jgi:outer membrane protein
MLSSAVAVAAQVDAQFIDQIESLMADGKSAQALAAMRSRETEFSGNPQFDYLLGLAALDAHQPAVAVKALQRVATAAPQFAGVRMELARAHYEQGNVGAARKQFQLLLADNPSPTSRAVINRYLSAIDKRAPLAVATTRRSWFVDVGSGYDSNANGSTSDAQFLGFTLNPLYVETASPFAELGVGFVWGTALSDRSGLNMYGRVTHRANTDASFVDQTVTFLGASYQFNLGATRATLGVNGFNAWLDGQQQQRSGNFEVGAARFLGDKLELSGLVRGGALQFQQRALQPLDVDRYLAGLALTRYGLRNGKARLGGALLAGRDEARRNASPFSNDKFGARLFGGISLRPRSTLYGELLYLDTRYDGLGFFGLQRHDQQYLAFIGFDAEDWPRQHWTVSPQIRFTDNRSNISLYSFDRFEAMIFVRRLFE